MTKDEFESLLRLLCEDLTAEASKRAFGSSEELEGRVRQWFEGKGLKPKSAANAQVFPDIVVETYGVEVKFTKQDTWRSVANSVSEGTRDPDATCVYIIFGKMGGKPEVRYRAYEEAVVHVRTSHRLRFEIDMKARKRESLFKKMEVRYEEFAQLSIHDKMKYIRQYAKRRLKKGERLWWLGPELEHSLPIQARLYTSLSDAEKRKLRAEAALLFPQIVASPGLKSKYDDAALYLLTYRGVLCHQARDLFSAGSVALRGGSTSGGSYIQKSLEDIQDEMRKAAAELSDDLFEEYWGKRVPPEKRILNWLRRANRWAKKSNSGWTPSETLFREEQEQQRQNRRLRRKAERRMR